MMYVTNTRFLAYLYEHVKMKSKIVTFKICLTCDKFAFSSAFSGLDCNFEQAGLCSYVNINDNNTDTFDWFRATGTTGSQGTGPSNDHTYGTAAGRDLTYSLLQWAHPLVYLIMYLSYKGIIFSLCFKHFGEFFLSA